MPPRRSARLAALRSRATANRRPAAIELVAELPKTAVGKIDKNRLRALLRG